jgi:beta-glucosidase/6-phospho-beta-glucosidase/beta-galactosidase
MSKNAFEKGIDVKGFFAWSIMDNYVSTDERERESER